MSETVEPPVLEYGWLRRSGEGVRGAGPQRLHNVITVKAWFFQGSLRIYARGQLLRKDGAPSRQKRSIEVDYIHQGQPGWLDAIIADAKRRLDPTPYEALAAALGPVMDLWACDHRPRLGVEVDTECSRCKTMGPLRQAYAALPEAPLSGGPVGGGR